MKPRLLRATQRIHLQPSTRLFHTRPSHHEEFKQANPIGDYYASILESASNPIPSKPPTTATPSSTPPIELASEDPEPEPSILFSSRLSSPLERRSEIMKQSTLVAGIWIPPKPEEPDNCCMSGCVNCVWDRYGEELEEWAVAKKQADAALQKEKGFDKSRKRRLVGDKGRKLGGGEGGRNIAMSMDDDGGGSETNWDVSVGATGDDLFKGVPVGIREFMKQERRLKEKHKLEGTRR